ncbi:hypothetical protein [Pseudanabaena sp. UWO310]|uniref:hypothetical protein n=1 Tax=Pseudanabaena sp. UWO310 TaxID=2480795 RepID=UPI00115BB6F8|nr:hypothetical protein [Pseudanabaena sp. UWO310]TYQ28491.1 hypothetical protein PseudUWO310_14140 [Pseudanabaena sp. UWO310]
MAIVLSNQEDIDLLLILVKVAIALGAVASALLILFWFRLKNLEKRLYLHRKQLKARAVRQLPAKTGLNPTPYRTKESPSMGKKRLSQTQVYLPTPNSKNPKKSLKRSKSSYLHWLLPIAIASITGIAIALIQLGNNSIFADYTTLIWFVIGVGLVVGATYAL